MSAFMLAPEHIRALVNYAFAYGVEGSGLSDDSLRSPGETLRGAYGRRLTETNAASVRALYADAVAAEMVPAAPVTFDPGPPDAALHAPLTILQGCQCYDYQSGSASDYETSWAARAIALIRQAACAELMADVRLPTPLSGWPILSASPCSAPNALQPRVLVRS